MCNAVPQYLIGTCYDNAHYMCYHSSFISTHGAERLKSLSINPHLYHTHYVCIYIRLYLLTPVHVFRTGWMLPMSALYQEIT